MNTTTDGNRSGSKFTRDKICMRDASALTLIRSFDGNFGVDVIIVVFDESIYFSSALILYLQCTRIDF